MNAIKISDLVGLSEPLKKLIEEVSKGVGSYYEPTKIRKKAKADSEAIKDISKAKAEALAEEKMIAKKSDLKLIPVENRIKERIKFNNERRQRNIDQTITYAAQQLPEKVSKESVSSDWMANFFNKCQDVSDEEIQMLWGKILAGEISKPGTFSYRTLDVLSWLNKADANLLQKILCNFWDNGSLFLYRNNDGEIKELFGIEVINYKYYESLGILTTSDLSYTLKPIQENIFTYFGENYRFINISGHRQYIKVYWLTKAGSEIRLLCDLLPNKDMINILTSYYSEKISIQMI